MSVYNTFSEKIILPTSDFLLGNSIAKNFKFLEESQWWSREEIDNWQNINLQKLIKHAYTNVPYYHNLFKKLKLMPDDILTKDDLYKLPILTKKDIRVNFPEFIVAKNIPKSQLIFQSSSGSTGEPLQFYITKAAESFHKACAIRAWYWMGYRLGDKYVKISQNPRDSLIKRIQDRSNNCRYVFFQQHTHNNLKKIVEVILAFKPKILRGYPDPLFFLAQYLKKNNIFINSIFAINSTGNVLFENNRNLIEEQFNCKIYDSYSCEGGANVAQCENLASYHSAEEYAISEFIRNENDDNAVAGERLIVTDLFNYAVPFIRYDSQDYIIRKNKICSCGRSLHNFEKINGRDSDILITPSGKYLIVHNFTGYFEWIESIEQFQVWQNQIDDIVIKIKVNKKFTDKEFKKVLNYWKNYIGNDVNVNLQIVDEIPLTASGKRRFLIRNDNLQLFDF
ncbi:MAG TPA: phenylacetate--CoA ligase family protein [bacterium]|nr:phenylacetate--CoA ligase family protein [bacterium]HPN42140.1 phenylacetate--CoA ligase family protein [bacterium]